MTDALPEVPDLDSSKVAGASFGRSRKGFEPTEVRTLLGRVADAFRVWEQRDAKLVARVEELSRRLDEAEEFDEDRVTEILGSETARIVAAARSAAADMRADAEREATDLLERSRAEAEETAQRLLGEAEQDREAAGTARSEAEQAASEIVARATETAEKSVSEARSEAESILETATSESEQMLSAAREESEKLRSDASARHDELLGQATEVLTAKTAAAEEAAAGIRARAEAELAEARAEAAAEVDGARKEAERLRREARDETTAETEAARERGREMLAETREVRQKMLRDLAEKNRLGRQKVEGAKAARAGVIDSIRATLSTLENALSELDSDDRELKRLADAAAAAVPDDTDTLARELEAELDASHTAADPGSAPTEADAGDTEPAEPESVAVEGPDDSGGDSIADRDDVAVDTPGAEHAEDASDSEVFETEDEGDARASVAGLEESIGTDDSTEADGSDGSADSADEDDSQMASVHDLFERLRSTEDSDGADHAADADPSSGPGTGEKDPDPADGVGSTGSGGDDSIDLTESEVRSPEPAAGSMTGLNGASDGGGGVAVAAAPRSAVEQEPTEDPEPVSAAEPVSVDQGLLDRRDDLLAPAERLLARNLKRLVGDEQNDVLDRVRRHKRGRVELDELLGATSADAFVDALAEPYVLAAAAGAQMWAELSGVGVTEPGRSDVTDRLELQVSELLEMRRVKVREALEAHDRSGSDATELVDLMRSAYRELRATTVPELAADLAAGAFNSGASVAAGPDSSWRWVPDDGGLPCADCEDDALEGPLRVGEPFPTGDSLPPAHPGCRCIVVPAAPR